MNAAIRRLAGPAALIALSGCVETGAPDTSAARVVDPPGMVDECIRQVRVGRLNAGITTRAPILAGPDDRVFVGMTVDGATWGCRIENDGSSTAFPNVAN